MFMFSLRVVIAPTSNTDKFRFKVALANADQRTAHEKNERSFRSRSDPQKMSDARFAADKVNMIKESKKFNHQ